MSCFKFYFYQYCIVFIQAIILRDEIIPECPYVDCQNQGTIDVDTCHCKCKDGFYGFFCEKERYSSAWPEVPYLIPKPIFNCPNETFSTGSIEVKFPADSDGDMKLFLYNSNLIGSAIPGGFVWNFCRDLKDHRGKKIYWSAGSYCIFQLSNTSCPVGFIELSLNVKDGYVLENPIYPNPTILSTDTGEQIIEVCCKLDKTDHGMTMPRTQPFYLLKSPNSSVCQSIIKMTFVEESISFLEWRGSDNTQNATLCFYSPEPPECRQPSGGGTDYKGLLDLSENGKSCLQWNEVLESNPYPSFYRNNYCRLYQDPLNDVATIGCFVSSEQFEQCHIPECEGYHSKVLPMASSSANLFIIKEISLYTGMELISPTWHQVDLSFSHLISGFTIEIKQEWIGINYQAILYVSKDPFDFFEKASLACNGEFNTMGFAEYSDRCYQTIEGRYVTLVPAMNTIHDIRINNIKLEQTETKCGKALGLTTSTIFDDQIQVSSQALNFQSDYVRLNSHGDWCATDVDETPYVQIDLMIPTIVEGLWISDIKLKGIRIYSKIFTVKYGMQSDNLTIMYDRIGKIKNFTYRAAAISNQLFLFNNKVFTRFLRIDIIEYHRSPCLKLELVGCLRYVQRRFGCPVGSKLFGYGLEPGKFLNLPLAEEETTITTSDINECLDKCDKSSNTTCNSIQFNNGSCLLRIPHKYNHQFLFWLEATNNMADIYGQRICTDGIVDDNYFYKEIYTTGGLIASPSYPWYDTGVTIDYLITVPTDTFLVLDILDIGIAASQVMASVQNDDGLDIWNIDDSRPYLSCHDQLTIRHHNMPELTPSALIISEDNQVNYIGSMIRSSNNAFRIQFSTCFSPLDYGARGFAFNISYDAECGGCNALHDLSCPVDPQICTANCGYLSSMYFPVTYKETLYCKWIIEAPDMRAYYVKLQILEFNVISRDSDCLQGVVVFADTSFYGKEEAIGRYCNHDRPNSTIYSQWGKMEVEFDSIAGAPPGTGFLFKYSFQVIDEYFEVNENDEMCIPGWIRYKESCYNLFYESDSVTWIQAEALCKHHGGHLICFESEEEMQAIYSFLTTKWTLFSRSIYIGLRMRDRKMRWVNGNPLWFTSWQKYQPDGVELEQCVMMKKIAGQFVPSWHDVPCAYDRVDHFLCEQPISANQTAYTEDIKVANEYPEFRDGEIIFMCDNREYISVAFVCNGKTDCKDGSDEKHCDFSSSCPNTSFTCQNGDCISMAFFCDFKDDCDDDSDEIGCVPRNCTDDEWRCNNGECISLNQRCNVAINCKDGSDEQNCDFCSDDSFQCYDGTCIPILWLCDSYQDCMGYTYEDERFDCPDIDHQSCLSHYEHGITARDIYKIYPINDESVRVTCDFNDAEYVLTIFHHSQEGLTLVKEDGSINLDYQTYIDDIRHLYSKCEQYMKIECKYRDSVSSSIKLMENYFNIDKSGQSHENCSCLLSENCGPEQRGCLCSSSLSSWYNVNEHEWLADSGYITWPISELVFGNMAFSDMTSAGTRVTVGPLVCKEEKRRTEKIFCDNSDIISISHKCLLTPDGHGQFKGCRDFTHLSHCANMSCPVGYYKCLNSYCVHVSLVCNGEADCLDNQDEYNCGNYSCPGFFRCKGSDICLDTPQICDTIKDCPKGDDEILCDFPCPESCACVVGTVRCLGEDLDDKLKSLSHDTRYLRLNHNFIDLQKLNFDKFSLLVELHLSDSKIGDIPQKKFRYLYNLYALDLSYNQIRVLTEGTFYGLHKLKSLNLIGNTVLETIEAGAFQHLRSLPTLSLVDTKINTLKAGTFKGMLSLQNLITSPGILRIVEDGAFESLKNLRKLDLRNQFIAEFSGGIFSGMSNLEQLFTDSFLLCCLKPESVNECLPGAGEFSSCDDLMRREELRVFMWIFGLSALIGNLSVILYRVVFDSDGLKRGYGQFVTHLGISDLCMGIYMLIIASADIIFRGRYVWNDLWWRNSPYCQLAGVLATVSSEASALFLCAITVDRFLNIKYPFGQFKISKRASVIISCCIWIISIIIAVVPILPGTGFAGTLYKRSGICLALPLTRKRTPGWEFSTGIFIFFNLFTFLLICVGQLLIYWTMVKTSSIVRSKERRARDVQVAKKLSLIVLTNFICWFPICCMGLMSLNGFEIDSEVYAWTAVFILPVNSALNPLLYTLSSIFGNIKVKKAAIQDAKKEDIPENESSVMIRRLKSLFSHRHLQFGPMDLMDDVTTLKTLMVSSDLSASDILCIIEMALHGLLAVHSERLSMEAISENDVLVTVVNGKIMNARLVGKIVSPDQTCTAQSDDIYTLGKLVARVLRWYASKKSFQ